MKIFKKNMLSLQHEKKYKKMEKIIKKIEVILNDELNNFEKVIIFTNGQFDYKNQRGNFFEFTKINEVVDFIYFIKQNWLE